MESEPKSEETSSGSVSHDQKAWAEIVSMLLYQAIDHELEEDPED